MFEGLSRFYSNLAGRSIETAASTAASLFATNVIRTKDPGETYVDLHSYDSYTVPDVNRSFKNVTSLYYSLEVYLLFNLHGKAFECLAQIRVNRTHKALFALY